MLAAAQVTPFNVKPGLWETAFTNEMTGPSVTPLITPDQRGPATAGGSPHTVHTRSCLTRDSLKRALNFSPSANSCAPKLVSSTSNKQQLRVDCSNSSGKSAGDITIERIDSEHVKGGGALVGQMSVKGTTRPYNIRMSFTAKFVSSDCGDVKPANGQ